MSTKLRRITISLPVEVDAAIAELAEVTGKPQAGVITGLLQEQVEILVAMAKMARQMKAGQLAQAKRTLQHTLGDQLAELVHDQLDFQAMKKKGKK